MTTSEFHSPSSKSRAFLDFSTAYRTFDPISFAFISGSTNDTICSSRTALRRLFDRIKDREGRLIAWDDIVSSLTHGHLNALRFLEAIVVYDELLMDDELWSTEADLIARIPALRGFLDNTQLVLPVHVPREARTKADEFIKQNSTFLKRISAESEMIGDTDGIEQTGFRNLRHVMGAGLAGSNDSGKRALYYCSIAAQARVPVLLSRAKEQLLGRIQDAFSRQLHQALQTLAVSYSVDMASIHDILTVPRIRAPMPAIQEWILYHTIMSQKAPHEVAHSLRETSEAQAYRRLLRQLTLGVTSDAGWNFRQAQQEILRIVQEMRRWQTDPFEGITYKSPSFDLTTLPALFGGPKLPTKLEVPLPKWLGTYLWGGPDRATIFISRWLRPLETATRGLA